MDATPRATTSRSSLLILALLGLAALAYQGHHLLISFESDDSNHLETPLILATSRQLTEGFSVLYGPFDGQRPLVLCHSPLYYRVVGIAAMPFVKAGVDPLAASRLMGRLVAFLGFLVGLGVVAKLARLDEAPWSAGFLAALLVVSSPVFGSTPFTVRPDTLAVSLQTFGVLLALQGLIRRKTSEPTLLAAYLLFAASACVKQHDLVAMGTTSLILALAWWRGEVRFGPLLLRPSGGSGGARLLLWGRAMADRRPHGRGGFPITCRLPRSRAGGLAPCRHRRGRSRQTVRRPARPGAVAMVAWACRQGGRPSRLDALLLFYLAAELAATAVLCKGSTGAWVNYAMQAVVWASLLVGRGLGRLLEQRAEMSSRTVLRQVLTATAALAAAGLLLTDTRLAVRSARNRVIDREAVASLIEELPAAGDRPDALYFVGAPDHNRIYGSLSLAHDEWLYTAFEAVGAAELRRQWLQDALVDGPVRYVIEPFDPRRSPGLVPGLVNRLPELGYELYLAGDRYLVWEREVTDRASAAAAASPSVLPPPGAGENSSTSAGNRQGVDQLGPGRPSTTATDAGPGVQPDLGVPRLAASGRRP